MTGCGGTQEFGIARVIASKPLHLGKEAGPVSHKLCYVRILNAGRSPECNLHSEDCLRLKLNLFLILALVSLVVMLYLICRTQALNNVTAHSEFVVARRKFSQKYYSCYHCILYPFVLLFIR
jgi:hypothetical protein